MWVLATFDHQDVPAPPVTMDEADYITSVHIANGRLLGTARAHDVETPDTLVEGDLHRTLLLYIHTDTSCVKQATATSY